MKKIVVAVALFLTTLVGGSGSGLLQNHASAMGCIDFNATNIDTVGFTKAWAMFNCVPGPYTWIRVKVIETGSAAWHYGGWVNGTGTKSWFTCWPGTHVQAYGYDVLYT